jgi:hypothetical protein
VQWDLSLRDPGMERCFLQRYARCLVLVDSAHCALLLLVALYALAQAVLLGSHRAWAAPLLGSGAPQMPAAGKSGMWVFMSYMLHGQECHRGPLGSLSSAQRPVAYGISYLG